MKTFKQKVLETVRKISKGKTMTYKRVARLAGEPKAYRRHRVIRTDGEIGGYNKGEEIKRALLKKESVI